MIRFSVPNASHEDSTICTYIYIVILYTLEPQSPMSSATSTTPAAGAPAAVAAPWEAQAAMHQGAILQKRPEGIGRIELK